MNYDPKTYQVTLPYPSDSSARIEIERQITAGELQIPPEHRLKPHDWIKAKVKEVTAPARAAFSEAAKEAREAFERDMEEEWGMHVLPEKCRAMIHDKASQYQRDMGCSPVSASYENFVEIALAAIGG